MFGKVLIANRGEIAVRVIRTCRRMGIKTVAVYSDADRECLHVKHADESVNIGPPLSRKSYLNADNILEAARSTKADAIHPGYGFLAESAPFAAACREAKIVFIGPSPKAMALAADKSEARQTLGRLGVPTIPGSRGVVSSPDEALKVADEVGYPVIIKAAFGGGGRGMRIAHDGQQLVSGLKVAGGEARASFGSPDLYLEKYLSKPRHIEMQILADELGSCLHLGERECSIQKRHQKLIEEAPSPFVDDPLRRQMGETAVLVARSIGYTGAGTVEFLVDARKRFYFMELNARLQVEHPVTEMVTGIDIVEQQILIAAGGRLAFDQQDIRQHGWSIECRINAEDPDDSFAPSPGLIHKVRLPSGPGVRVDTHIYDRYEVPPFYDSLIAKLVVWGEDRRMAIDRMQQALSQLRVEGLKATVSFHERVFRDRAFIEGDIDTHFLERPK